MYNRKKHCRWCGLEYFASKPPDRDGFCCVRHKQAHYRAFQKYVTKLRRTRAATGSRPVTQKKRKVLYTITKKQKVIRHRC